MMGAPIEIESDFEQMMGELMEIESDSPVVVDVVTSNYEVTCVRSLSPTQLYNVQIQTCMFGAPAVRDAVSN